MSRYIDADALLKEWKIELPKKRPVKGEHAEEFLVFMKKYENHPYYFAILSLYLTEPADVVEVVRCEDCRYWENRFDVMMCNLTDGMRGASDYCSYGERRNNE